MFRDDSHNNNNNASSSSAVNSAMTVAATFSQQYADATQQIRTQKLSPPECHYELALWIYRKQFWVLHLPAFEEMILNFYHSVNEISASELTLASFKMFEKYYNYFLYIFSKMRNNDFSHGLSIVDNKNPSFAINIIRDIFANPQYLKNVQEIENLIFTYLPIHLTEYLQNSPTMKDNIETAINLLLHSLHPQRQIILPPLLIENLQNQPANDEIFEENPTTIMAKRTTNNTTFVIKRSKTSCFFDETDDVNLKATNKIYKKFFNELFIEGLLRHNEYFILFSQYTMYPAPQIFMEFANQYDLTTSIFRLKFSPIEKIILSTHMLLALRYMHSQNILHRDFKEENILVFEEAGQLKIKLADLAFGICMEDITPAEEIFRGTYRYAAPEVLALTWRANSTGKTRAHYLKSIGCDANASMSPYSFSSDVWAFFCAMISMLTQNYPYFDLIPHKRDESDFAVFCRCIVIERHSPLSSGSVAPFLSAFSASFNDVLNKGFDLDPRQRPKLTENVLPVLRDCYQELSKTQSSNRLKIDF